MSTFVAFESGEPRSINNFQWLYAYFSAGNLEALCKSKICPGEGDIVSITELDKSHLSTTSSYHKHEWS